MIALQNDAFFKAFFQPTLASISGARVFCYRGNFMGLVESGTRGGDRSGYSAYRD
jgi:hypothetical protein